MLTIIDISNIIIISMTYIVLTLIADINVSKWGDEDKNTSNMVDVGVS